MAEKDYKALLQEPFKESEIEWRVQSSGLKKSGDAWCKVLAYVSSRAVQERLDSVFGVFDWGDEYRIEKNGTICRLSVYDFEKKEWIAKENGAQETDKESFKGGISSALKRVASSGFGIGRYLYRLEVQFAKVSNTEVANSHYFRGRDKKTNKDYSGYWITPYLPQWALPKGQLTKKEEKQENLSVQKPEKELPLSEQVGAFKDYKALRAWYEGLTKSQKIEVYPQVSELDKKLVSEAEGK